MAKYFEIKIDEIQLDAMLAQLNNVPKSLPRVMRNAVNDTANSARVEIAKRVSKAIKIKQAAIKRRIPIKKATLKNWRAWVRIKDSPLSLMNFGAKQTAEGVRYRGVDGGKNFQERAFIGKGKIKDNVWIRMKKGGIAVKQGESLSGAELVRRKPLQRLVGPSIAELFNDLPGLASEVISNAMQNLNKNVKRHINLILGKKIIMSKRAA